MSQRLEWLDFARGASILLVVMFHATMALEDHGTVPELYWFSNNLFSPIRMPVFFLVSGFLARNLLQRSWLEVLRRRVALLAYLFTVWTVIHFCLGALVPFGQDAGVADLLTSFHSPSSVLWFVWALAFYTVVAKAGLSTSPALVMATSVLSSVVVHAGYISFDSYVYANVLEFMPFFLFGAWYSSSVIRSEVFRSRSYVLVSLALYVALFVALYEQLVPSSLSGPTGFLLKVLGVNVGVCVSILACRSATLARMPLYLGRNTLAVYVAHFPIVQLLSLTLSLAGGALWLEQVWAVPVVASAAIVLSLLLKVGADRLGAGWLYALPAPARQTSHVGGSHPARRPRHRALRGVVLPLHGAARKGEHGLSKRPLTPAERALIERIAASSSHGVLTASRPRVVVSDEVDERGQVQWTTTVALSEVLPGV